MAHGHGGGEHGIVEGENKKIAILISVLALFLAIAETVGKSAQTSALSYTSRLPTCGPSIRPRPSARRRSTRRADQMEVDLKLAKDPTVRKLLEERVRHGKPRPPPTSPSPRRTARARVAGNSRSAPRWRRS